MKVKQAVVQTLNIESGEERLLILVLSQAFLQNLSLSILYAVSFALFLTEFTAQTIPVLYIVNAILVSLVAFGYLKVGERIPFPQLLWINFGFQVLVLGGFHFGLLFNRAAWIVFALAIGYEILANLGALSTWSLAGRVFNLRQGKRLFGIIGVSEWTGTIVAGILVGPLIRWTGIENVILACALIAAGMLVVLYGLQRQFSYLLTDSDLVSQNNLVSRSIRDSLNKRYIWLIFSLVFLWYMGFYFLDNIFFAYSAIQYPQEAVLASFLGFFWTIVGIVAVMVNFVAGRIISSQGVRSVLLYLPALLIILSLLSLILSLTEALFTFLFGVVVSMRLLMSGFGSLDRRAQDILYQPLPLNERGKILTVSEGIVRPLANGLAGGILLLLGLLFVENIVALMIGFLGLITVWLVVATLLGRDYPKAIAQALNKRFFDWQSPLDLNDKRMIEELQRALRSSHAQVVIYSLDLLTQVVPQQMKVILPDLLTYPEPEVRKEVLRRMAQLGTDCDLEPIRVCIQRDGDVEVRGKAVETLAILGQTGVFPELVTQLDSSERAVQIHAMSGLLRYGGIEGVLLAGQRLLQAAESSVASERAFAAEVLGKVGIRTFYQPLLKLLKDPDLQVQQAAIQSAGCVANEQVWPQVMAHLDIPANRPLAMQALIQGGGEVLPLLISHLNDQTQSCQSRSAVAQICGRIGGSEAVRHLQPHISQTDMRVRTQVLYALKRCGYQATEPANRSAVQSQIKAEGADAAWLLALSTDISAAATDPQLINLLKESLAEQIAQIINRIFILLSFLYEANLVQQAQSNHQLPSAEKRAYALETLDIVITETRLKRIVLPLLKDTPSLQKQQALQRDFPQPSQPVETRLQEIITAPESKLTNWSKVCALQLVGSLGLNDLRPKITPYQTSAVSLLRKTAVYILHQWQSPPDTAPTSPNRKNGELPMLSIIEKVLILKTVGFFSNTPSSILANMADLLTEIKVTAGEIIFSEGDIGDSLYIIVTGKVKAHNGDITLNYLEAGQLFGEMALLDAEARSASITAVEPSLLLKLDQIHFYELMAEYHDISRGIIQVLSRHLRSRIQDLNQAKQRIHELESRLQ